MPHRKLIVLDNIPAALISFWKVMITKDLSLLEDERGPLVNLDEIVPHFNLPPLPPLPFGQSDYLAEFPNVKATTQLDENDLIALRKQIYYGNWNRNLNDWAEKILRHCEIQRLELLRLLMRRFGGKLRAELFLLQLVAFLIDFYYLNKDLRFLNAGLKVYETHWRRSFKRSFSGLDKSGVMFVCALFHVRFLIMSEYAFQQLKKGF